MFGESCVIKEEKKLYEDIRYELKDLRLAMLVGAYDHQEDKSKCQEYLHELASLAETYGFEVIEKIACPLRKIDAGTYLGSGKIQELVEISTQNGCDVIIFDEDITPNQQKNLEKIEKEYKGLKDEYGENKYTTYSLEQAEKELSEFCNQAPKP